MIRHQPHNVTPESAERIAREGAVNRFGAVACTSAAVAYSNGYPIHDITAMLQASVSDTVVVNISPEDIALAIRTGNAIIDDDAATDQRVEVLRDPARIAAALDGAFDQYVADSKRADA